MLRLEVSNFDAAYLPRGGGGTAASTPLHRAMSNRPGGQFPCHGLARWAAYSAKVDLLTLIKSAPREIIFAVQFMRSI